MLVAGKKRRIDFIADGVYAIKFFTPEGLQVRAPSSNKKPGHPCEKIQQPKVYTSPDSCEVHLCVFTA